MSLFQNKSDYFLKGDEQLDVFHLGAHGCDVMFSRYEAGTVIASAINPTQCKCLIVQGSLAIQIDNQLRKFNTGDWFEIPGHTEYRIEYQNDCSVIEFWFDPPRSI